MVLPDAKLERIALSSPPKSFGLSSNDAASGALAPPVKTITLYKGKVDVDRLRSAFTEVVKANPQLAARVRETGVRGSCVYTDARFVLTRIHTPASSLAPLI